MPLSRIANTTVEVDLTEAEVSVLPVEPVPAEKKRIYVIVPHTVSVTDVLGFEARIEMEPGRLMAQCAHVVSGMRGNELVKYGHQIFMPFTTIVLEVRNSKELELVRRLLIESSAGEQFGVYSFSDTNPDFYGTDASVRTAICTSPVYRSQVEDAIGHLELYVP